MAKVKISHVTRFGLEARWNPLRDLAKKNNLDLEISVTQPDMTTPETLFSQIQGLDSDWIVVEEEIADLIFSKMPNMSLDARTIGSCDLIVRTPKGMQSDSLLNLAFLKTIGLNMGDVARDSAALIVGNGGKAMQVASCIVKMGFHRIHIIGQDTNLSEKFVKHLKSKYFNIEFEYIPIQKITTLPGVYSILVSTLPLTLENKILEELYFFNFLEGKGAVLDLATVPIETPLLREAKQWGNRHMPGYMFLAMADILLLEKIYKKSFDVAEYTNALKASLETVAFDIEPFIKQFKKRGDQSPAV